MAQKIINISKPLRKIRNISKTLPRIDQKVFEDALGVGKFEKVEANTSSPYLLILRREVLNRLHSEGGRPALSETTRRQKIPLKDADWQALVDIADKFRLEGINVAPAQIASVILHDFLHRDKNHILNKLRSDLFEVEGIFESITNHKRILTLIIKDICFIPVTMEAVLLDRSQEVPTIEEFKINLNPGNDLPTWLSNSQIIIKRVYITGKIKYSCRIDPPPSDDEKDKGQLIVRIRDDIGCEGIARLAVGDSNRKFEMQKSLSANLVALAIDILI